MATINPRERAKEGGGGGGFRECGPGKRTLFPIGHRYREINHKPVVDVRSVCLHDPSGSGDEGAVVTDTFWLTDAAMWRIARFALAVGYDNPFDPEDPEDLTKVLLAGPFVGTVSIRKRGEKEYRDVNDHEAAGGFRRNDRTGEVMLSDEQRGWVESAEQLWAKLLAKVADSGGRSGGGRSGGGRSGGGYGGSSGGGGGGGNYGGSDIPF